MPYDDKRKYKYLFKKTKTKNQIQTNCDYPTVILLLIWKYLIFQVNTKPACSGHVLKWNCLIQDEFNRTFLCASPFKKINERNVWVCIWFCNKIFYPLFKQQFPDNSSGCQHSFRDSCIVVLKVFIETFHSGQRNGKRDKVKQYWKKICDNIRGTDMPKTRMEYIWAALVSLRSTNYFPLCWTACEQPEAVIAVQVEMETAEGS